MTTSEDPRAAAEAAKAAAARASEEAAAAMKRAQEAEAAALAAEKAAADDLSAGSGKAPAAKATKDADKSAKVGSAIVETVKSGYAFEGLALDIGALVDGDPVPDAQVRIPIAMLNRHGLVAGATGTGKTKTLQVLAEQLSANGVPVFAADIKGDLSGIATPGAPSDKLLERTKGIGQDWKPTASPTEYFTLGGLGTGVPIRATISSFGPILLSKVLGLNETQESSLGLVFHYADKAGLALVDLDDLRSVLQYLTSDDGKQELKDLGGLSASTAGVILRELITFADQGADKFFGEPEIDTADFLRTTSDGKGIVSLLEVPGVQDKPALFSTFLMWLLADLFQELPEVGDADKPRLVFFFDEAHLLFADASKSFLQSITQTVRLIRSKGVGIFFVTQTPKDVPSDVLAQLGSRVQHQLRAHTPEDAKALKATVSTYPTSAYDLGEVLQQLATGEAVVTVMNDKGAPSPVAWTRVRAPQGSMDPTPAVQMTETVNGSPLLTKYGTALDPESAKEILARKLEAGAAAAEAESKDEAADAQTEKLRKEADKAVKGATKRASTKQSTTDKLIGRAVGEASRTIAREIVRGIFGAGRKR